MKLNINKSFPFIFALLAYGCASSSRLSDNKAVIPPKSIEVPESGDSRKTVIPTASSRDEDWTIGGVVLANRQFDYPITLNASVEKWVDYFTRRGRKHFERYLERSELFVPYIQPLLKQYGMPEDLVYLAMIESGFSNHAYSRARAVGPWQFISATGKRYGLAVNWWVDERRDTKKSTLAAIKYLRDLHNLYHSWELAAASYNAGEAKVARAIKKYKTNDFWELAQFKYLKPETRNYVPKIIAAALIAKNRTQFGFKPQTASPGTGEAIAPDGEIVKLEENTQQSASNAAKEALESVLQEDTKEELPVAKAEGGDAKSAANEDLQADMEDDVPTPPGDIVVSEVLDSQEESNSEGPRAKAIPTPHVNKKGELRGEMLSEFEVQSPADLLKISRAAGLSYHTVKSLNPELLRWCTPPHASSFRIKLPVSVKDRFLSEYNSPKFDRKVQFVTYKVKAGQSLKSIARHFGIRVDPLSDLNGLSPQSSLRNGALVKLPMPKDFSRSVASLEIRDPPERRRRRAVRMKRRARKPAHAGHSQVTYEQRLRARRTSTL